MCMTRAPACTWVVHAGPATHMFAGLGAARWPSNRVEIIKMECSTSGKLRRPHRQSWHPQRVKAKMITSLVYEKMPQKTALDIKLARFHANPKLPISPLKQEGAMATCLITRWGASHLILILPVNFGLLATPGSRFPGHTQVSVCR